VERRRGRAALDRRLFGDLRAQALVPDQGHQLCCSEHSQYDPAEGGRVLAGPAPQPLAAILLEHDAASDALFAVGTLGGEMFNEFFSKFEFRLALEHNGSPKRAVAGRTVVQDLDNYCKQQVKC
jgi:arsenite oxidase small subunit